MRYLPALLSALFFVCSILGCSADKPAAPDTTVTTQATAPVNPEHLAGALIAKTDWEVEPGAPTVDAEFVSGHIPAFSREVIVEDIVHYSAQVRIGPGPFDVIGIHRVVRETRPYRPVRTRKAVFMQHGDAVGFVKFLFGAASPNTPDDHAAAVYLAQNGVDVWGIDQDWILVPEGVADFSFMADWGLQHNVDNGRCGGWLRRGGGPRVHAHSGLARLHTVGGQLRAQPLPV